MAVFLYMAGQRKTAGENSCGFYFLILFTFYFLLASEQIPILADKSFCGMFLLLHILLRMFSTISPLHIFIFGNHSLLFLSSDCSPLIKELIDFLILQIDHNLACPAISFQFHFREIIFQYE